MKTITKCIKEWLKTYEGLKSSDISTEILDADMMAYALSKEPTSYREDYIDGTYQCTNYYTFFISKPNKLNLERDKNDAFIEDLERWISDNNLIGNYPKLDGNRIVDEIVVNSSFYLFQSDNKRNVYNLTLMLKYRQE